MTMRVQHLKQWALSPKNNKIDLYASPEVTLKKPCSPIILIGGVHGDEPEGVELAKKTLGWLINETASLEVRRLKGDESTPVAVPWIVIPCLNVDGFQANTRVNGNGVDLNRNYPAKSWSAKFEKDRYYPGPHAASEPEIRTLVQLITDTRPRLIIHCHSWEPSIVLAGPPALSDAQHLSESSGYAIQDDIGYPTPGSLSEYGWFDNGIPVICIEEQEHIELEKVWPHFEKGIKKIFGDSSTRR